MRDEDMEMPAFLCLDLGVWQTITPASRWPFCLQSWIRSPRSSLVVMYPHWGLTVGLLATILTAVGIARLRIDVPSSRYIPNSVDLLSATTHDILQLLGNGTVSSTELVSEYQHRIRRDNHAGVWLKMVQSGRKHNLST